MTLVLNLTTRDYVIQVSDRRLTKIECGRASVADDEANKATVFNNYAVFGFTGLAMLRGQRTDIWLAKTLAGPPAQSLSDTLRRLRDRVTATFRFLPYNLEVKRHAFACAGWARFPNKHLMPIVALVSNFHDECGRTLPKATSEFSIIAKTPTNSASWMLVDCGARIYAGERKRIERDISNCTKKSLRSTTFVRTLVRAVRDVAGRDVTVGKSLQAVILPRAAAYSRGAIFLPLTDWNVATKAAGPGSADPAQGIAAWYFPKGSTKGIAYGPNLVAANTVITNPVVNRGDHHSGRRSISVEASLMKPGSQSDLADPTA